MTTIDQANISNRLLSSLSEADFRLLASDLETIALPQTFVLSEANKVPSRCFFLLSGIASIVATSPRGQQTEVGLLGRDGMTPTVGALYTQSYPHSIFMQVPGHGLSIDTDRLMNALDASLSMHKLLARYGQTLLTQTAFTALSNAVHQVEERLARWILMCHDRTDGNAIELTHEFLSITLSVRRPSVTTALHVLASNRFIGTARGVITVRDRAGLEAFAADAYGRPESEYVRLIGPLR